MLNFISASAAAALGYLRLLRSELQRYIELHKIALSCEDALTLRNLALTYCGRSLGCLTANNRRLTKLSGGCSRGRCNILVHPCTGKVQPTAGSSGWPRLPCILVQSMLEQMGKEKMMATLLLLSWPLVV